jgi:hypothetical protein
MSNGFGGTWSQHDLYLASCACRRRSLSAPIQPASSDPLIGRLPVYGQETFIILMMRLDTKSQQLRMAQAINSLLSNSLTLKEYTRMS